jgi:meso-butanediol dehydrogenase/(S,S)-butanediol dehydrogenase/diacetyl reductase
VNCRRFDGKIALVTGGGSGIGRATAIRLSQEGAGVTVCGRRLDRLEETVQLIEKDRGRAAAAPVDLREPGAAERAVAMAVDWGGRLDAVINAAGTFPSAPFPDAMSDREWADALEINLSAPMRICRAATAHLRASHGVIVNVSSINAEIGDAVSMCAHYSAAKAGLLALTRQLAAELAPAVRVVAVVPGAVDTPILEGWLEDPDERQEWLRRYVPLARIARPEEIGAVITFLASDDASYLTGVAVMADGGMSIV